MCEGEVYQREEWMRRDLRDAFPPKLRIKTPLEDTKVHIINCRLRKSRTGPPLFKECGHELKEIIDHVSHTN